MSAFYDRWFVQICVRDCESIHHAVSGAVLSDFRIGKHDEVSNTEQHRVAAEVESNTTHNVHSDTFREMNSS